MNMLDSKCNSCGVNIIVSQSQWSDPFSHVCIDCMNPDNRRAFPRASEALKKAMKEYKENQESIDEWDTTLLDGLEELEDMEVIDNEFEGLDGSDRKCTCGGEKAKTPHSTWCDIYV